MVNYGCYKMVLRKFRAALGRRRGITRDVQWFQQDGPLLASPVTLYFG